MNETEINVKIDHFDGPLGLLLLLIQKEEMDIKSLDVNAITKQYLDYLMAMEQLNFDMAGEYLYMAATLLLLKSKFCVTEEDVKNLIGEEIDGEHISTKAELIRRLELLRHFQKLGEKLWNIPRRDQDVFVKPKVNRRNFINNLLVPMDVNELTLSMMDYLSRQKRKYKVVKRDRLSIKEKLEFLKSFLEEGSQTTLKEVVGQDNEGAQKAGERVNTVITFISLLELARLKRVSVFQNEAFGDVYIQVRQSLKDFDVEMADGFDEESEGQQENAIQ